MELICEKEILQEILKNSNGCIIYGAGLVSSCVIKYLISEKLSSKIICIAVKSKEKNPVAIMGIPVHELKELEKYREHYLFLVATLEHLQENISVDLIKFGCKKIYGIADLYYAEIRETLNDYSPDIMYSLKRGFENINSRFEAIYDKMDRMQEELTYLIEEQNEISVINTRAFAEYRNCYHGKDIVIVATGPTLNDYKPFEHAVHIGVNTAYKNANINLDFLFVQDGRPSYLEQGKFEGIENIKCKVFMGRVLKRSPFGFSEFPEKYRVHENVTDYIIDHIWPNERIYRDICYHPVSGGVTVTFSALHFALYTYPKRIYLVGCDSTPDSHFDGSRDRESPIDKNAAAIMKKRYQLTKEFAQIHYPDTEIISINPVGLKGIFKDIYTK